MTETKTPMTPSPTPGTASQPTTSRSGQSQRGEFLAAAMGMSWQLAVAVLVPIVGGFELDKAFATSPLLLILGFIIAMASFTLIVRHQLQIFTPPPANAVDPNGKEPSK